MGADLVSDNGPNNHEDDRDAPFVGIPSPRPAADDTVGGLPKVPPPQQVWRYDQRGKRGKHRRYTGYVTPIGGAEGERLRGELAAVIRDLLDWAKQQTDAESTTDTGQDGEADDIPS